MKHHQISAAVAIIAASMGSGIQCHAKEITASTTHDWHPPYSAWISPVASVPFCQKTIGTRRAMKEAKKRRNIRAHSSKRRF